MQWFVGLDPRFYSLDMELPEQDGTLDIVNSSELWLFNGISTHGQPRQVFWTYCFDFTQSWGSENEEELGYLFFFPFDFQKKIMKKEAI